MRGTSSHNNVREGICSIPSHDLLLSEKSKPHSSSDRNDLTEIAGTCTGSKNKTGSSSTELEELRRLRACDSCRALKVRCVPNDENNLSGVCQRCLKSSKNCTFTLASRKRQKRTDTRVADLEKKVNELTARLSEATTTVVAITPDSKVQSASELGSLPKDFTTKQSISEVPFYRSKFSDDEKLQLEIANDKSDPLGTILGSDHILSNMFHMKFKLSDIVWRVLKDFNVTNETAQSYLKLFRETLTPHLPFIVIPTEMTFENLVKDKPLVSLAIISTMTAKTTSDLELCCKFNLELYRLTSEQVVVIGNKNLDMLQALLITITWYNPTESLEFRKFHLLISMALSIATDLGVNGQFHVVARHSNTVAPILNVQSEECRRICLALFISSTTASSIFRYSVLMRWSNYIEQCCELFETPAALPGDRCLAYLGRLSRINISILDIFHPVDQEEPSDLRDSRLSMMIKVFEHDLENWKTSLTPDLANDSMMMMHFQSLQIFLHEVGLHSKSNRRYFRAPFDERVLKVEALKITPIHAETIIWCVTSCQTLIDTFCSCSANAISSAPISATGRLVYACTIILKVSLSSMKSSSLREICPVDLLKPEYYFARTYMKLTSLCNDGSSSLYARKFRYILGQAFLWFKKLISENAVSNYNSCEFKEELMKMPNSYAFDGGNIDSQMLFEAEKQKEQSISLMAPNEIIHYTTNGREPPLDGQLPNSIELQTSSAYKNEHERRSIYGNALSSLTPVLDDENEDTSFLPPVRGDDPFTFGPNTVIQGSTFEELFDNLARISPSNIDLNHLLTNDDLWLDIYSDNSLASESQL
ncbi:hypothetical protein V1511DRAFT_526989 [Dipodascopsis uninucleata]